MSAIISCGYDLEFDVDIDESIYPFLEPLSGVVRGSECFCSQSREKYEQQLRTLLSSRSILVGVHTRR